MAKEIYNEKCKKCTDKSSPASILNKNELEVLCSNSTQVSFQKGERIIKQGAFTKNIVFIKSGIIKTHMTGPCHRDEILKIFKGPKFVGIPDIIMNRLHSHSVTAFSDTEACFINSSGFLNLIENNGRFAVEVLKELSENHIDHLTHCVNKVQKQLTASLAEALLYFSNDIFESNEFYLPLTRSEFGAYIGTTRESVTKIIQELARDQIIKTEGKNIRILKKEILKKISYS